MLLTDAYLYYLSHIATDLTDTRQHSITPNRLSFEEGSAEHLLARAKHIPSEHEVNALFNKMLVKYTCTCHWGREAITNSLLFLF